MWRTFRSLVLETGDSQNRAMEELEECNTIAVEMTRFRSTGFELVDGIAQNSTDPESREAARRAMVQFVYSEGLLNRIATHLNQGLMQVDGAQTSTLQAMSLLTHWREGR